jgi:hypothetical protein
MSNRVFVVGVGMTKFEKPHRREALGLRGAVAVRRG